MEGVVRVCMYVCRGKVYGPLLVQVDSMHVILSISPFIYLILIRNNCLNFITLYYKNIYIYSQCLLEFHMPNLLLLQ